MTFTRVLLKSIYRPTATFKDMSYSSKSITLGWFLVIGFGLLYTLTAIILSVRDFVPFTEPSIPVPFEDYYFWQSFFTLPVGVVGVGLNYLVAVGLLRLFSVKITNQKLWGPISAASVLPFIFTAWIPETFVVALFYAPEEWTYMTFDLIRIAAGSLWAVILTIIAVQTVEDTKWWKSIITGIISSGVMGMLMGICYR